MERECNPIASVLSNLDPRFSSGCLPPVWHLERRQRWNCTSARTLTGLPSMGVCICIVAPRDLACSAIRRIVAGDARFGRVPRTSPRWSVRLVVRRPFVEWGSIPCPQERGNSDPLLRSPPSIGPIAWALPMIARRVVSLVASSVCTSCTPEINS